MKTFCLFATAAFAAFVSAVKLRPISIADYEDAVGLHRRALDDFSDLGLQNNSQLMYHGVSSSGQHHLANLTIIASNGLPMVTMERFESLTSSVNCNGDDGTISLTFHSENAYNFALREWAYINENDGDQFLLIGNHVSCGADDDRQPYLVSRISEDPSMLTTYLIAQPVPWSEVAGTYDLDFGHLTLLQEPKQLKERSIFECADGDCDLDGDFSFPVEMGKKGERTNIVHDPVKVTVGSHSVDRFVLDCTNCYISGSFKVVGRLKIRDYDMKDLVLTVSPHDLSANFEVEATLAYSEKPDLLNLWKKETWKYDIPDAGISIGKWLDVGATLHNEVGCGITFKGSANVAFGVDFSIPNNAQAKLDVCNPEKSSASGWFEEGSVKPMANIHNASGSVTFEVFDRPKLVFGVDAKYVEKFDVSVQIKMPVFTQSLEAAYDASGLCDKNFGALTTGVKAGTNVGVTVDMVAEAKLGKGKKGPKKQLTYNLYSSARPISTTCVPLFIPGLVAAIPTSAPDEFQGA